MDYRGQVESLLYDAKDWAGDPHIRKDLHGAAQSITDLLARAEAAEARADEAEASLAAAVRDMEAMAATIRARPIDDTECCFLCKYDGPVEDYCPGWEGEECFRWRGT